MRAAFLMMNWMKPQILKNRVVRAAIIPVHFLKDKQQHAIQISSVGKNEMLTVSNNARTSKVNT